LSLPGLHAQELDHAPLATDPALTFSALLEQTLTYVPDALQTAARAEQAQTMTDLGQSWTAGRPSLQMDVIDDRLLNDLGQRELTWGVALPLWRPGQRRAMQARGAQYDAQAAAWEQAFTLDVAGRLRPRIGRLDLCECGCGGGQDGDGRRSKQEQTGRTHSRSLSEGRGNPRIRSRAGQKEGPRYCYRRRPTQLVSDRA
jgi:hypothetical protein